MDTVSVCESSTSRNEYSRSQQLEDTTAKNNSIKKLEEAFPWLAECNEAARTAIREKNYQNLEGLIALFTQ
ncbi:hypothetical protein X777_03779 [Ooceraea biroi]|nr:hypothetical protein X777_03779 [Ooceraea biroi]